jgi:hypothetical protein
MFKLQDNLIKNFAENLPTKFGLLFDGWSHANIHYLATFAVFSLDDNFPKFPLLEFLPLKNEEDLSASSYNEAFNNIMLKYKRDPEDVLFLIGDNCATNIKASRDRQIPLIGCASHRLNLAVKLFLTEHNSVLEKLNLLMKKFKTIKGKAFLKNNGFLMAKSINQTRWSSTFKMIERYLDLINYENGLIFALLGDNMSFLPLLLSPFENKEIKEIFVKLQKMNSVCLYLQKTDTSLSDVRILFDKLVKEFPIMSSFLSADAEIIKYPQFESGIVKLQNQEEHLLNSEEKKCLDIFLNNDSNSLDTMFVSDTNDSDFAYNILKQKKIRKNDSLYRNVEYIVPSSNMVERLFSVSKDVITDKRKSLKTESIDMIMFLKSNRQLINRELLSESLK